MNSGNTKKLTLLLLTILSFGCNSDNEGGDAVNIRVANTGSILLQTVIIDHMTFKDIPPEGISEYQVFNSEIGLPPSYFSVKTTVGERALVYDYVAGAKLDSGSYTFEIRMNEDAGVHIKFPPD